VIASEYRLAAGAALSALLLSGCVANAPTQPIVPSLAQPQSGASKTREILYVLVASNSSPQTGSVVLYDAYAKSPKVIRTVSDIGAFPGSIWTDDAGNVYVGISGKNLPYEPSFVSVYSPGMAHKPIRTYQKGIGLPFGGAVDSKGTTYVSDGGLDGQTQGDIAVFPAGKMKPSQIKFYNVYTPHGIAVDAKRNIFAAMVYGTKDTFVVEFPHDAYRGIILPLDDLGGGFLQGLVLDDKQDIVVANESNAHPAVQFYPPPYKDESSELTSGIVTPTGLAYAPNGSLFVGNQFVGNNGNVVVFPSGASTPSRTISTGINGQVFGVAVGAAPK
jgi:sugar lactone lactonase YvrE